MRSLMWMAAGLFAATGCLPAQAQKADVIHFWTSGGNSEPSPSSPTSMRNVGAPGWTILRSVPRRKSRWR